MKLLDLKIIINTPWDYFRNLGCLSGMIAKHKAWEFEYIFYAGTLVEFNLSYGIREDHAGFEFVFGLLGYTVRFHIYDTRHWDYDTKNWAQHVV